MTKDRITPKIANFAAAFQWQMAPEETRRILQLSLLDFSAVALAGVTAPVSRVVRDLVRQEVDLGCASMIGGGTCPARSAALVNATIAHALDYDDTHFAHIGHLAVTVFPAALATAEQTSADGRSFLAAALVGYEVATCVGSWLGRSHYEAGFHQTATSGIFGAAMASACLLGLDVRQMQHMLGLAATRSAGLKAQFGTMGKPYNAGAAASAGVETAFLVAGGMEAAPEAFTAFGKIHGAVSDSAVFSRLGETFTVQAVSHKYHACCHGTHAALEAIGSFAKNGLRPQEIARLTIHVHPRWLAVCNIEKPQTGLEAKFSYRMVAAICLAGRDTGALENFDDAICKDPELCRLRDKVAVLADDRLEDTQAQVVLSMENGKTLRATADLSEPRLPDERAIRIRKKAASLLGKSLAADLWQVVRRMDTARSPEKLAAILRNGPPKPS